jgi:rare lipoprotein A (peptidoglycan hydrolase)
MPRFGNGRRAFGLFGFALVALLVQQLVGTAALARETIETDPDLHNLRPLKLAFMNAAVPSGQFEELVKPTPTPTVLPTPVPSVVPTPAPTVSPTKPPVFEHGIASTYGLGDGFEGNLTACGQVFRTQVVQVAHKSLPCGTLIRIEDIDTGLSVDAEVTDRGPYIRGRIVDLSWGAFKQLDASGPGLLSVNVYVLN